MNTVLYSGNVVRVERTCVESQQYIVWIVSLLGVLLLYEFEGNFLYNCVTTANEEQECHQFNER